MTTSDDANALTEPGVYGVSNANTPLNAPAIYNGVIVVYRNTQAKVTQLAFDYNYTKCWFRTFDGSPSPTYKNWVEITTDLPSFYKSYSDLSSLASALGGVKESDIRHISGNEGNLDGAYDFGVRFGWCNDSNTTRISDVGLYLDIKGRGQFIFNRADRKVWFRARNGEVWDEYPLTQ